MTSAYHKLRISLDEVCGGDEAIKKKFLELKAAEEITKYKANGRPLYGAGSTFNQQVLRINWDIFQQKPRFSDWQLVQYIFNRLRKPATQLRHIEGMEGYHSQDKQMLDTLKDLRTEVVTMPKSNPKANLTASNYGRQKKGGLGGIEGKIIPKPSYDPLCPLFQKDYWEIVDAMKKRKIPKKEMGMVANIVVTLYDKGKGVKESLYGRSVMVDLAEVIPFAQALGLERTVALLKRIYDGAISDVSTSENYGNSLPRFVKGISGA
jgi:hypothetical protein